MSSADTLDFESLLSPIPGDNPGGEPLRYAGVYDSIEEARRADDNLTQGDWQRDTKPAEWRRVVEIATDALAKRSKDVQIAAWLTEALIQLHGFAGLRDGCRLTRQIVEQFWESFYPESEDGDVEPRGTPFEWMNQRLPQTLKMVPIARSSRGDQYGWWHWQESRTVENLGRQNPEARTAALAEGKTSVEDFDKAVAAQRRAHYETLFADVSEATAELRALDEAVDRQFGNAAPSLVALKQSAEECRALVETIVKRKRELEPDAAGSATAGATGEAEGEARATGGMLADRAGALQQLAEVAAFFRRTEPHSPVSYLVQRAVQWGRMPLEDWLQEVIKDEVVLAQLRDTLGLKSAAGAASGESAGSEDDAAH